MRDDINKIKEQISKNGSNFRKISPVKIKAIQADKRFVIEQVDEESRCYYTQIANPGDWLCQAENGDVFFIEGKEFESGYEKVKL